MSILTDALADKLATLLEEETLENQRLLMMDLLDRADAAGLADDVDPPTTDAGAFVAALIRGNPAMEEWASLEGIDPATLESAEELLDRF